MGDVLGFCCQLQRVLAILFFVASNRNLSQLVAVVVAMKKADLAQMAGLCRLRVKEITGDAVVSKAVRPVTVAVTLWTQTYIRKMTSTE